MLELSPLHAYYQYVTAILFFKTDKDENVVDYREFRRYVNYEMDGDYTNMVIQVARDGKDFYFKKLYSDNDTMEIDCWIKGSLEDGVITMPSGQLVGVDKRGYFCYNAKTYIDWEKGELVIDNEPVKFIFDEQSESMSTEDWLLITQGHNYPFITFLCRSCFYLNSLRQFLQNLYT